MNYDFNVYLGKYLIEKDKSLFLDLAQRMNRSVIILDQEGRITYLNCHAEQTYCWSRLTVQNQYYNQLCQELGIDVRFITDHLNSLLQGMIVVNAEIRIPLSQQIRIFSVNAICFMNQILITGQDVTKLRAQEEVFQKINGYLYSIFKYLPGGVFWKDLNGQFLGANEVLIKAAGLSDVQDIIGLTDFDCPWTKEESLKFRQDDANVIHQVEPKYNFKERITWRNGQTHTMIVSKIPLLTQTENVIGTIGIFNYLETLKQKNFLFDILNQTLQDSLRPQNRCFRAVVNEQEIYLTRREVDCLKRWILGRTSKEIGSDLGISHRTTEIYLFNIKNKLGLRERRQLTDFYLEHLYKPDEVDFCQIKSKKLLRHC